MDGVNGVDKLGKYGLIGVMLALIILTGSSVWILYKLVGNHIDHNTGALMELSSVIEGNTEVLRSVNTLFLNR